MESMLGGAAAATFILAPVLTVALFGVVAAWAWAMNLADRVSRLEKQLRESEPARALPARPAPSPLVPAVALPEEPVSAGAGRPPVSPEDTGATQAYTTDQLAQLTDTEETHIGPIDLGAAELPLDDSTSVELPRPEPAPKPVVQAPPAWTLERVLAWGAAAAGGFFVLLAGLFALVVISERGWVGPAVRVSGALTFGVLAWNAGTWLRRGDHRALGAALSGAGVGVLYGGLFAATSYYGFIGRGLGFALLVLVSVVAVVAADRQRDRLLAVLATVGGLLTPVLVSSGENNPLGLFAYLSVLLAGTLAVAHRRGWPELLLLASSGASALHLGWSARWYEPDQAPAGLLGALVLSLPPAVVAARVSHLPTRVVASAVALCTPALALPWLVPVDPWFTDPRTGLAVLREGERAPWAVAAALFALPLPGWLAARWRRDGWFAAFQGLVAGGLVAVASIGGAVVDVPAAWPLIAGVALALAAPAVSLAGWRGAGAASGLTLIGACVATVALGTALSSAELAMLPAVALAAGGAALGVLTPGWGAATVAALALAPALVPLAARGEELGSAAVAAPALLGWALLATWPLLGQVGGAGRHLAAAVVPLVVFVPLYLAWEDGPLAAVPGALPLMLGLVAVLGAGVVARRWRAPDDDLALAALSATALFLISAVFPAQIEESWLTVSWAIELAALAWLGRRLTHPMLSAAVVVLAALVAVRLLLNPYALAYGAADGLPVFNWTLWTWGLPTVALLVGAAGLRRPGETTRVKVEGAIALGLVMLAIATGFALLNVQVSDLFQDAGPIELSVGGLAQGMVRSVSWGAYGLLVLVIGLWRDSRAVRLAGFAVVMLATLKVFAVDLWALSGFARVGSVLGLGVSLLVAAFLFERLVLRGAQKREDA